MSGVCPSCALIITDNRPEEVLIPAANHNPISTNQNREQGRITRNRNVNGFKYYTVIDGVLQEQPNTHISAPPNDRNNTRQAGHAERQVLHQNQLIFSSIPSPSELNIGLLNTLFVFKPASDLKTFLFDKTQVWKTYYSLAEILTILKNVVRGEGLFDPGNPTIIFCSPELEKALNMKALHVPQVRDQVLSHVIKVPEYAFRRQFIDLERQREHERQRKHNNLLAGRTPRHPIHPDNKSRQMRQQLRQHVLQRSQSQIKAI